MVDFAPRLTNRVQLTTDGLPWYPHAVEEAPGWNGFDYAQIQKKYGQTVEGPTGGRFNPSPIVVAIEKTVVMGKSDGSKISTSYVERPNLSIRMGNRRFTHLTNAFSKKAEKNPRARRQPLLLPLQLLPPANDADQSRERNQDYSGDGGGHF
jgi:hypothetical protein